MHQAKEAFTQMGIHFKSKEMVLGDWTYFKQEQKWEGPVKTDHAKLMDTKNMVINEEKNFSWRCQQQDVNPQSSTTTFEGVESLGWLFQRQRTNIEELLQEEVQQVVEQEIQSITKEPKGESKASQLGIQVEMPGNQKHVL